MTLMTDTPKSKAAIIIEPDEDNQEINVGLDIDGDGQVDIQKNFTIDDPRVWAIIGWILLGISVAKNAGLW